MIQVYEGDGVRPSIHQPINRTWDYDRRAGTSGTFMLSGREFGYSFKPTADKWEEWLDIFEVVEGTEPRPVANYEAGDMRGDRNMTNPVYDANGIATRYAWSFDVTVGQLAELVRRELRL